MPEAPTAHPAPSAPGRAVIPAIARRHADDAAGLHRRRTTLTHSARASLGHLEECDEHLAAHLDGLVALDEGAWTSADLDIAEESPATLFLRFVRAIERGQHDRVETLVAACAGVPGMPAGIVSAFGWSNKKHLQGIIAKLLASGDPSARAVGVAACSVHRVDPGLLRAGRLVDVSPAPRARALRAAGDIGCREAADACRSAIRDDDPECRFRAAMSCVLLGDADPGLDMLSELALVEGPYRQKSFALVLQALPGGAAHELLRQVARDPAQIRRVITGSGMVGDPSYVPWLISHMVNKATARIAGAAFSLLTGIDLTATGLDSSGGEGEPAPSAEAEPPGMATGSDADSDEVLPWPDADRVDRWWAENGGRYHRSTRYFMGAPVTREHCIEVLKNGYQRQRILAAYYLCLLEPGTPLFNTSAPAWRQQRLLADMK